MFWYLHEHKWSWTFNNLFSEIFHIPENRFVKYMDFPFTLFLSSSMGAAIGHFAESLNFLMMPILTATCLGIFIGSNQFYKYIFVSLLTKVDNFHDENVLEPPILDMNTTLNTAQEIDPCFLNEINDTSSTISEIEDIAPLQTESFQKFMDEIDTCFDDNLDMNKMD
jgi:hypothetical protein